LEQNPSFVGTDAPLAQAAELRSSAHRSGVSLKSVLLDVMRLSFILVILLATTAIAQSPPQQLLGLWHSVSTVTGDGRNITPSRGGWEREFRRDGTLVETVLSPTDAGDKPLRYRTHYTFRQPDRIIYTLVRAGQAHTRQQRFHVNGDIATFENLESGIITKMRRIPKSEFKAPKDISDIQ